MAAVIFVRPNSGVIAAGIQVIPTLSLTLTKLVPLRLTCQWGIASPSGHPPCSAPTRGGHGRGKPLRSKSACWRTMIYCYPSASSDQSRIRLTYHRRPLSIQVCPACCGVRLDRCGGPIDALLGDFASPTPCAGGSPPAPHWDSSLYLIPFVANVNYQLAQLITTFRSGFPRRFFRY